uniref:Uncharacterized protein n=1 Tax=Mesocestoides corti TaxID=53468 RepID=A0A5K3ELP1_MESCO
MSSASIHRRLSFDTFREGYFLLELRPLTIVDRPGNGVVEKKDLSSGSQRIEST